MPFSTRPEPVIADQAVDVGGRGRAERAQVAADDLGDVGLDERAAQPPVDVLVDHAARLPFQVPRGGSWASGAPTGPAGRAASAGSRGTARRAPRRAPSAGAGRRRAAREGGVERVPVDLAGRADVLADLISRSCTRLRSTAAAVSASSGVSRWMVPRIVSSRTSERVLERRG